ncbi:MAG: hypothetical protein BGO51_23605 [Rhodospirillales bacterium 69-11]|nr:hypothetical protein [Rhodospirillales bacterium]OJW22794.1 MAG: hypothetical protein BGO51_23605 [Rhodospirillales bacterium 69-11]
MALNISLDYLVKERLRRWPQHPPGMKSKRGRSAWLRARPTDVPDYVYPYLKLPGSSKLRTLPDGLWLNFGGTPEDPYVDIFAVEACVTMQNLLDKRSRFAPSTSSTLAVCPLGWLLAPITRDDPTPRWRATGVIPNPPTGPLMLPVRDVRVLYGLGDEHYRGFTQHQLPYAHEFFVPMRTLTEEDSERNPALRQLVARATAANYISVP